MNILPAQFEGQDIRRVYDEASDTWWFAVVDVVQVLTQQADFQTARKYWNQLKRRLEKEGSESVTSCRRLKLPAADGKNYLTDVATELAAARPQRQMDPAAHDRAGNAQQAHRLLARPRDQGGRGARHPHEHHSPGVEPHQRQGSQEDQRPEEPQPAR